MCVCVFYPLFYPPVLPSSLSAFVFWFNSLPYSILSSIHASIHRIFIHTSVLHLPSVLPSICSSFHLSFHPLVLHPPIGLTFHPPFLHDLSPPFAHPSVIGWNVHVGHLVWYPERVLMEIVLIIISSIERQRLTVIEPSLSCLPADMSWRVSVRPSVTVCWTGQAPLAACPASERWPTTNVLASGSKSTSVDEWKEEGALKRRRKKRRKWEMDHGRIQMAWLGKNSLVSGITNYLMRRLNRVWSYDHLWSVPFSLEFLLKDVNKIASFTFINN